MVDILGHLQSGHCALKLKAGDPFEMLAPPVELREVTYQKNTICTQTAVSSADLSSTHSSQIPCYYENRQFDFVNTRARSLDSSDGIQTKLWDRWRSNQRSIPVRDNRSFFSRKRSKLHRDQHSIAGSFPGGRAVVAWSLQSHQYNAQVQNVRNYLYTPHVTKAWCVINDCSNAKTFVSS